MDWATAFFLSLFQGIAEFLPISSSGHLLLLQTLFGKSTPPSLLFTTFLHLGTMCAILVGLRKTILALTRQDLLQLFVGLLPLVPLVFALKWLKPWLSNPHVLPYGFICGGLFLLFAEMRKGGSQAVSAWNFNQEAISGRDGLTTFLAPLLIGVGQAISVLPGISRLGTTVAVALLMGWGRERALIFSLLLSVPTVAGAVAEELLAYALHPTSTEMLAPSTFLLSFLVAFGSGLLALQLILIIARKASFKGFALYCIVLGTLLFYWFNFHATT
jgi:undecaprenyl-diphosphatase